MNDDVDKMVEEEKTQEEMEFKINLLFVNVATAELSITYARQNVTRRSPGSSYQPVASTRTSCLKSQSQLHP